MDLHEIYKPSHDSLHKSKKKLKNICSLLKHNIYFEMSTSVLFINFNNNILPYCTIKVLSYVYM